MRESTLRRGLAILSELANPKVGDSGKLVASRLAESLGLHRSQVTRTLQVLEAEGFVDRSADRGYRLGWRVFVIGRHAGDDHLRDMSELALQKLVAITRERCYLAVLQGSQVVNVCSRSPMRGVEVADWVGHSRPVYATSSGRALLIDASLEDLKVFFRDETFAPIGPNTPRTVSALNDLVMQARKDGYALADEEIEPDVLSVAVPIRRSGQVVAALGFAAAKYRLGNRLPLLVAELRKAGMEMSNAL